ncbi:hypothetical protein ACP70R_018775 [Stipagrostis hirtigluma subsp. patula]
MAVGLGLLVDLASRVPRGGASASAHSHAANAAAAAATAAAALSATGVPFSARHLFGFPGFTIAHCDAGATAGLNDAPGIINDLNDKIHYSIQNARTESFQYPTKEYPSELKPLFSAFGLKNFGLTTLRSLLLHYLPLIQPKPHSDSDDDEEDLLQDAPDKKPVDLVTPFHNSVKQIMRETSIVTTRRVLERIAVRHVSQRTAWKLLKDASKSAKRKAARGMPTPQYTYCVARTTFRSHALGVAAAWVVQSLIEVYRCFFRKPHDGEESFDDMEKFRLFGRKIYGITIKSCFSLVLASIGAGIGALVHPVHGQWFGCALGDVAGPVVAIIIFEKFELQLPL